MKLFLIVDCAPLMTLCSDSATANFDDVDLEGLLAATLVSFSAKPNRRVVVIRWRTGTEVDVLGYNVYRARTAHRVRLNKRLIPARSLTRGGVSGGAYSYVDRRAPRRGALRYWLQQVDAAGHRTWHGPVRVVR